MDITVHSGLIRDRGCHAARWTLDQRFTMGIGCPPHDRSRPWHGARRSAWVLASLSPDLPSLLLDLRRDAGQEVLGHWVVFGRAQDFSQLATMSRIFSKARITWRPRMAPPPNSGRMLSWAIRRRPAVGVVARGDRLFGDALARLASEVRNLVEQRMQGAECRSLEVSMRPLSRSSTR
jgi:hypothetical protein